MGNLSLIPDRRRADCCGRQDCVPRSRAPRWQNQWLDPRRAECPPIRFLCCERYLLLEANPIRSERLASRPESAGVRARGYHWKASLIRRSFEGSSWTLARFLSRLLVTVLQLRVAEFRAAPERISPAWR